ncbi:MAG: phospholipid carrier-dependent glycosyltransferase, partial [Proteobacteria bacterium]|nr:phospholipid carrier-dependent glycosyltransferase [Pseudomonadota bacterium]
NSFYITPDAPMVAAWAAAIYFLVCIIQGGSSVPWRHWLGLGVSLGLGLLSKYSIALVGLAAFITFIVDRDLRRWFLRLEPYLAAALAITIFSPVIYWNATNDWASFAFQGTRRLSQVPEFALHEALAHLLLMVSPVGFFVAIAVVLGKAHGTVLTSHAREVRFLKFAFAVPVAVFLFSSLRHEPRFTWMGPSCATTIVGRPSLRRPVCYSPRGKTSGGRMAIFPNPYHRSLRIFLELPRSWDTRAWLLEQMEKAYWLGGPLRAQPYDSAGACI